MCGLCIIFTVIDVTGAMHFWGLTVDCVACTILVLAVGLCVDYAAHICKFFKNSKLKSIIKLNIFSGLAFMGSKSPTKTERARDALSSMGPAVFHGGFSTFLGIVILIKAQTVAAFSFFKIFTLVVIFGLFHGLIFLPVLLSIFGPDLLSFQARSPEDTLIEEKRQKGQEMYALNGKQQADVCKVLVEE
jgi:Niemann-Pick C1 protein